MEVREVEGRAGRGGCWNTATGTGNIKPPRFDGPMSWTLFQHQFEAMAEHDNWADQEKAMHLLATLQG
jgi:hypothetical protein